MSILSDGPQRVVLLFSLTMATSINKRKALLRAPLGDVFMVTYLAGTLGARFFIEGQLEGRPLISISLGLFAILLLWALKRVGIFEAKLWP